MLQISLDWKNAWVTAILNWFKFLCEERTLKIMHSLCQEYVSKIFTSKILDQMKKILL